MRRLLPLVLLLCLAAPTSAVAQNPPEHIYTGVAAPSDTSATGIGYYQGGPTGIPTTCWFEYGPTPAFGSRTDAICAGTSKAELGPLSPGTLYHYRAVASNSAGVTYGADKPFTTLGSPPPGPPPPPAEEPPTADISVLKSQTPAAVARRGLRLQLTLLGNCPCTLKGRVRHGRKTVGTVTRQGSGTVTLTIRMRAAERRKLRHARRATLAVRLTVTDTAGRSRLRTKTVRLKRR